MMLNVIEGIGRRLRDLVVGDEVPADDVPFHPVVADLLQARNALLKFVPPELAFIILDFAQYWAPIAPGHSQFKAQSASASTSPNRDATNIYIVSDPIVNAESTAKVSVRAKRVQFVIRSKDQGWSSDTNIHSAYSPSTGWLLLNHVDTYRGHTWHEAAILRPGRHSVARIPDFVSWLASSAPIELESAAVAGYDTRIEVPVSESYVRSRWLVQKNYTASRQFRTHVVTWNAGEEERDEEQVDIDERRGAGLGDRFVDNLEVGDRIALFVRSKYPGWVNDVESATITVFYGLA
ncbi:hypothetical protein MKEN_00117400 [Mycena kentingensis (nom. inval.)]|nr:hypothetical protein MKEN_00117400 [Mycena kentingensis (nom. inval.)]